MGEVYHPGYGSHAAALVVTRANARRLLIASSGALALVGAAATFAPVELLRALGTLPAAPMPIVVQLLGALYLSFAITNWTAKGAPIGGIYSRPISLGNLLHFTMGAIALAKYAATHGGSPVLLLLLAGYVLFAAGFGWLVFGPIE